ncbi:14148_t:CDS:2 [Entrophospora sp. SA101]|nr:14148_t:CDS:2 [Entrophospora sp. SA101]CAJ0841787.1 9653_t:CDS:2 [Entrophospora sp. SA101]
MNASYGVSDYMFDNHGLCTFNWLIDLWVDPGRDKAGGIFGDEKRNLDENVIQKEWYAMTEFTRASKKWKHRIIIIIQLKRANKGIVSEAAECLLNQKI